MSRERHERVSELFGRASELVGDARASFLAGECADDPSVLREVNRLLAYDAGSSEFMAGVRRGGGPGVEGGSPVRRIGRYTVESVVGSGGMGVVYRCTQDSPSRTVAVKLLRSDGAPPGAEERLRREGQFLANLQHPNIAHVFDAGIADVAREDGAASRRPFIAMEFIDGVPIDEYAERERLGERERLRLLADVCDAVHHAHQRAVIHRDLKPSNILVDGEGRARVLDFGIAADADDPARGGRPGLTGTLVYMSPEQLADDDAAPDTRGDVYALGVTTYKLLTGSLPHEFDGLTLRDALDKARVEPARPARDARPDLPDDLASCIDKAIAKDPEERYASVQAFADDVRNLLADRPAVAHGRSVAYVSRKFAIRHKGTLAGVILAIASLLAGFGFSAVGYVRAERARAEAEFNAANQGAMATYLEAVIFGADPEIGGADLSYLDALGYAANRIDDVLIEHPVAEAHARSLVGFVFRRHGRYGEADAHLRQAYRLRREVLGESDPLTATSRQDLAMLIFEHGGRADEAATLMERTVETFASSPDREADEAWARTGHAAMLLATGRADDALAECERAEAIMRRAYPGSFSLYAAYPMRGRAEALLRLGRAGEASGVVSLALAEVGDTPSSEYLRCLLRLTGARAALARGELESASESLDACERLLVAGLSAGHPYRAEILIERAVASIARDDFTGASRLASEALAIRERHLAASHWMLDEARVVGLLCAYARDGGRAVFDENDPALTRLIARLGQTHPRIFWIMRTTQRIAADAGDPTRAEMIGEWLERAEARRTRP